MRFIFILAISYYFKKRINCDIINLDKGVEPWQSGNAADSKSAEPVLSRRTGSNPVGSLENFILFHRLSQKPITWAFGAT